MVAHPKFCAALCALLTHGKYFYSFFVISCSLPALWIRADICWASWKMRPLRGVSCFKCCASCSSHYCPIAPAREKQNREIPVAASDNPALRSGVGELPAVTTKPTAIRMLVCHGGVSVWVWAVFPASLWIRNHLFWISEGFFPPSV